MRFVRIIVLLGFTTLITFATTTQFGACIQNLRQIDGAKEQLQIESGLTNGAVVTITAVAPYIKGGLFPTCPAGGSYSIGVIGTNPTCSIPGHSLTAPALIANKVFPARHGLLLILPPLLVLVITLTIRRLESKRRQFADGRVSPQ